MKSIPSLILVGLLGAVCAGESTPVPPYGAADFLPTAQTPIGYRADGNGWYPGANPPIEWWDGTPELRPIKTTWNNETHNFLVPADKRNKNIFWKAPLPGISDSQPIVVGDRVLTICDPDLVLCHDVLSGKLLWQDKLAVMLLPVLGKNRKSLDPAPDPAKAKIEQVAWELVRAGYLLEFHFSGRQSRVTKRLFDDETWPIHRKNCEKVLKRLPEWKALLGADAPASYLAGFDDLIKSYQEVFDAPDGKGRKEIWWREGPKGGPGRRNAFTGAFCQQHKANPVVTALEWQGDINGAFSTPVSDGEIMVVCFAYGQFAAYEVASGKRLWAFRDSLVPELQHANHGASPLMYRDLVLIRSGDGQALLGLDKKTGAVRWETQIQMHDRGRGANHGNYITPLLMDIPVAEGGKRTVLVTQEAPVLDPLTGEVLGRLEIKGIKDGNRFIYGRSDRGTFVGRDGEIFTAWGYDGPCSPTYGFRLGLAGGKLTVTKGPNACLSCFDSHPIVYRPGNLFGDHTSLFDPANGNLCWIGKSKVPAAVTTMCGDLLISPSSFQVERRRIDFCADNTFFVSDARDPQRQRLLSDRNVLDGSALPADPIWDTYLQGFDKKVNMGGYHGLAGWFGPRAAGIACRGERLFIQSPLGLWCIGPAVKGLPTDDSKIVATIRASKTAPELLPRLASDSAQYRYESVTRLAALKTGFSEELTAKLKELLIKDPYEEIRAGALNALDAAVEKSGWTAYLAELCEIEKLPEQQRGYRQRDLALTLKALGEGAQPRLTQTASNSTDPIVQRGLLFLATYLDIVNPALTEIALATVAKPSTRETDGQLLQKSAKYLCATGGRDPRAIAALSTSPYLQSVGDNANQVWLEALLLRSSLSDLPKYLELVLRGNLAGNWFYGNDYPLIATAARRLDPTQAIPLLENIAAEVPAVAKNLEPVVKMLKTPVLNPLPDAQAPEVKK